MNWGSQVQLAFPVGLLYCSPPALCLLLHNTSKVLCMMPCTNANTQPVSRNSTCNSAWRQLHCTVTSASPHFVPGKSTNTLLVLVAVQYQLYYFSWCLVLLSTWNSPGKKYLWFALCLMPARSNWIASHCDHPMLWLVGILFNGLCPRISD